MIESGLVEEVKGLIKKYGKIASLLKTLGYKEICDWFDNKEEAFGNVIEKIQKNTRHFARKQLIWFRKNKDIQWHYIDEMGQEEICRSIIEKWLEDDSA